MSKHLLALSLAVACVALALVGASRLVAATPTMPMTAGCPQRPGFYCKEAAPSSATAMDAGVGPSLCLVTLVGRDRIRRLLLAGTGALLRLSLQQIVAQGDAQALLLGGSILVTGFGQ